MVRRINELESQEHELWFAIRKTNVRFFKQVFCLITGLKFGPLPDIFLRSYEVVLGGIHTWKWNQKSNEFNKTMQMLEACQKLWAHKMLEPKLDEAMREYWSNIVDEEAPCDWTHTNDGERQADDCDHHNDVDAEGNVVPTADSHVNEVDVREVENNEAFLEDVTAIEMLQVVLYILDAWSALSPHSIDLDEKTLMWQSKGSTSPPLSPVSFYVQQRKSLLINLA
ncbi:Uncharacterized protein TCM_022475 [Theobroma cacao]|uniref:Uncharacterized protein n=1 Tax=Theobroma cacao TaxID=3641 RepID=A0A061EU15_THECC|nr:Uncharacterized protein TCM_022475 [Theobroma cacao]